uniref:Uncharacterized protein n=1 Tax=Strigamia maritima TaxID=126957 RepID=T1J4U6_STRMM
MSKNQVYTVLTREIVSVAFTESEDLCCQELIRNCCTNWDNTSNTTELIMPSIADMENQEF